MAFELSRELRRRSAPLPCHLLISGSRAPHIPEPRPLHQLPETDFLKELRRFSGTPEAVLQSEEIMQVYIPILRADFAFKDACCHSIEPPLDVPISAYGGTWTKRLPWTP